MFLNPNIFFQFEFYGGSIFCLPHRPNFSDIFDFHTFQYGRKYFPYNFFIQILWPSHNVLTPSVSGHSSYRKSSEGNSLHAAGRRGKFRGRGVPLLDRSPDSRVKFQRSTNWPTFLMISLRRKQFFEKIMTGWRRELIVLSTFLDLLCIIFWF